MFDYQFDVDNRISVASVFFCPFAIVVSSMREKRGVCGGLECYLGGYGFIALALGADHVDA